MLLRWGFSIRRVLQLRSNRIRINKGTLSLFYLSRNSQKIDQKQADDQLFPVYVMKIVGNIPGLPGLFIAGVFGAALRYALFNVIFNLTSVARYNLRCSFKICAQCH